MSGDDSDEQSDEERKSDEYLSGATHQGGEDQSVVEEFWARVRIARRRTSEEEEEGDGENGEAVPGPGSLEPGEL